MRDSGPRKMDTIWPSGGQSDLDIGKGKERKKKKRKKKTREGDIKKSKTCSGSVSGQSFDPEKKGIPTLVFLSPLLPENPAASRSESVSRSSLRWENVENVRSMYLSTISSRFSILYIHTIYALTEKINFNSFKIAPRGDISSI